MGCREDHDNAAITQLSSPQLVQQYVGELQDVPILQSDYPYAILRAPAWQYRGVGVVAQEDGLSPGGDVPVARGGPQHRVVGCSRAVAASHSPRVETVSGVCLPW